MAGFKSPLFLLGLGATGQQVGYRNALPIPPFGARAEQQAGFATPLPLPFGWAGEEIPLPPEIVERIKGGGDRIREDDEEILAVIMAAALHRDGGTLH